MCIISAIALRTWPYCVTQIIEALDRIENCQNIWLEILNHEDRRWNRFKFFELDPSAHKWREFSEVELKILFLFQGTGAAFPSWVSLQYCSEPRIGKLSTFQGHSQYSLVVTCVFFFVIVLNYKTCDINKCYGEIQVST